MAAMASYRAYYTDAQNDPYNGTYVDILNEYDTGANTPQELRNKVYTSGNAGRAISHLALIRDANQVGDGPGRILTYHRATRHDARIGQTTPFDNIGYSFLGDVNGTLPPMTVILVDDLFNSANATQVPTAARIDQLLAADPNLELLGPFNAGDPDIEAVTVRRIMYVPPSYLLMALDASLSPREAWQQIRGAIVADGKEADCAELIDWLRVCLTRRAAGDQPRTTVEPPLAQSIADPVHAGIFQTYRMGILHQDLPQLSPNQVGAGAQAISNNIASLVDETRRSREDAEARRVRDSNKTPKDLYGPALSRLLRYAQVANEAALQPIHTQLAKATKQLHRKTLQAAVSVAIEQLDYRQDFPVTAALTKKVLDLDYHSNLENDFSVGLNPFCVGPLEPLGIEAQRRFIAQTDALVGNTAAPTLADITTVQDPSGDVYIPRTVSQLRYNLEKYHALMLVLLGSNHPLVIQTKEFRDGLVDHERDLERAQPRTLSHRYIVPALVGRRFQLETNYWMLRQARTPTNVEVPDLCLVFHDIALQKDWAPDMPDDYVTRPPPHTPAQIPPPPPDDASALTTPTGLGTDAGGSRTTNNQGTQGNMQVRNTLYNGIFDAFRKLGHRIPKIRERCRDRNIAYPKNDADKIICLAYHVKGFCNERCGAADDHKQHTEEEDKRLETWCKEHYRLDE